METNLQLREPNIAPIKERLSKLVSDSLALTVTGENTQKRAGAYILSLRDAIKAIEAERHTWTDPLEEQKKRHIAKYKPVLEWVQFAEAHLKQQLGDYFMRLKELEAKEQERLQKLAQKRFDKAVQDGKPTPFPVAIAPKVDMVEKSIQTEAGKITYITQRKPMISDITKVPYFYQEVQILQPDMKALQDLIDDKVINKENCPVWLQIKEESYIRGRKE